MSAPESPVPHTAAPGAAARPEYLVFALGAERYAVDILMVQEIRAFEGATRVAGAPPFILGVINLRGAIVPVVDLRLRFGVGDPTSAFSVVIVFQLGRKSIGAVVDGVADVAALEPDEIRSAPEFSSLLGAAHIRGLATTGEDMLVVLDVESLLLAPEMALVDGAASQPDGTGGEENASWTTV